MIYKRYLFLFRVYKKGFIDEFTFQFCYFTLTHLNKMPTMWNLALLQASEGKKMRSSSLSATM